MALRKLLILPQLIYYGVRAPRDQGRAWDRFWSGIRRTGPSGEVLWDTEDRREIDGVLAHMRAHLDLALPLLDLGCGNGRLSRLFATDFPRVLGVDVSGHAIEIARQESRGLERVSYR